MGIQDLIAAFVGSLSRLRSRTRLDLLASAAEQAGDIVMIADRNGIIEYVNASFETQTGYGAAEAVGRPAGMLKSGVMPPGYYRTMWAELLAGRVFRGEVINRCKDGRLYHEDKTITPIRGKDGEIAHFVSTGRDVTARKAMEERLRLWARALDATVNSVIIAEAAPERHYPVTYANPAFERITGYRVDEIVGQGCGRLHLGDPDQPGLAALRAALGAEEEATVLLRNYRKDGQLFWNELHLAPVRDERGAVTHFVGIQNDVTERVRYEAQLEHQASHDALTGLPNRVLLADRIDQGLALARRQDRGLAVMMLDIDHFKDVNDGLGHPFGDRLIREVARRLAAAVRETDTVARYGGDEFVFVLPEVASDEQATLIADKLLAAIAEPFRIDGRKVLRTASVGIALYPRDGEGRDALLMHADAALYRAKNAGRASYQFYSEAHNREMQERVALTATLREAVEREELELHYQPRVDIASGRINGMEALLRWTHPALGAVPPDRFIPLAEESGLIGAIGEWVLRQACRQVEAWRQAGLGPLLLAVNFSCRQFRQPDLAGRIVAILKETGLPPQFLEMEITESALMEEPDRAVELLAALRRHGVRVAIDDFGTGYSSLSHLMRFPINTLKIDRSLVAEITSNADAAVIAKTMIAMAHEMRLTVVAEGVETEAQRSFLALRYCDEMQGFYFSRPLPAAAATGLLATPPAIPPVAAAESGERTLLLVDDEENILSALTRLFRRDGYRILRAASGNEAMQLLATAPAGVILCDQRMPGTSGTEFLRQVRRLYPNTVRMVLSGYTELTAITNAVNEGAIYKFLTKPWDDERLRAEVRDAFAYYEMLMDNERGRRERELARLY